MRKIYIIVIMLLALLPVFASAATYWVSPTGTAAWVSCQGANPLAGTSACSLAAANTNAAAGDTVNLRGGTYYTTIAPANSGTSTSRITFKAYTNEVPIFTVTTDFRWAIKLQGRSYITIDGIKSLNSGAFYFIGYGSSYNEIKNCVFDTSGTDYSLGLITWANTAGSAFAASNHNWIHNNVFTRYGHVNNCVDTGTVRISSGKDDSSSYNTIENNVFSYGGHDAFDVGGQYNVIRNNVFHNDEAYFKDLNRTCTNVPASGYFGNRNIILTNYGDGAGTAYHTLVEGNRIGYSGVPPDDDGSMGIENAGAHTIARYNYIFGNGGSGYYSKMQGSYTSIARSGSWARVYQNSIYRNGFGDASIGTGYKYGVTIWSYVTYDDWPKDVVIKNNIVYDNRGEWKVATSNALPQVIYSNNYNQNPGFVNVDMSDKKSLTLPNLELQASSPAIDGGSYLTRAVSSGSNSVNLVVEDAFYFQDGSWGSALTHGVTQFPDWIAIGSVSNVVQIKSIDYPTNKITLVSPMAWSTNAPVWLYKNSGGKRVLYGSAPDYGAYEYTGSTPTPAACTEADWSYSDGACQVSNTLTRSWTRINLACQGGVTHPVTETVGCTYILPTIVGDLNGDSKVDIADLSIVALNFGKSSGFDVRANVVKSTPEIIDIADLSFVARRFTG